jgi:hypothetical protein
MQHQLLNILFHHFQCYIFVYHRSGFSIVCAQLFTVILEIHRQRPIILMIGIWICCVCEWSNGDGAGERTDMVEQTPMSNIKQKSTLVQWEFWNLKKRIFLFQ